jgi:hypothetical protein
MKQPDNPPFEAVLEECITAVKRGLGRKRAGAQAKEYWVTSATPKIKRQLKKVRWEQAKKRVLPTGTKMGAVAAALTGKLEIVPLWAAKAAAKAVKQDPKCPNPGPGRGGFCP